MKNNNHKPLPQADGLTIGIVRANWHNDITTALEARARAALKETGMSEDAMTSLDVPGAFELPQGVIQLLEAHTVDAVIAIGCLVEGETAHFDYIASAVTHGLMRVSLDNGVPVIFGVLTVHEIGQAENRASIDGHDLGYQWGIAAVEMARVSDGVYTE